MSRATFNELLEAIGALPVDEQAELLQIACRRLTERGRKRIRQDIGDGRRQFDTDGGKVASVDDIMREICS